MYHFYSVILDLLEGLHTYFIVIFKSLDQGKGQKGCERVWIMFVLCKT